MKYYTPCTEECCCFFFVVRAQSICPRCTAALLCDPCPPHDF